MMRLALYILTGAATVLAWIVAARRKEHRAVAVVLSLGLVVNLCRAALLTWVLPPPDPTGSPWSGWLRAAGVLDSALFVAWPTAVAALALWTLARRSPWLVLVGYAVAVGVVAVANPRGDDLRRVYLATDVAALAAGIPSLFAWFSRRGERATVTTLTAAILVAGHFATVVTGPYRFGLFGEVWVLEQLAYLVIIGIILLLHLAHIWRPREPMVGTQNTAQRRP